MLRPPPPAPPPGVPARPASPLTPSPFPALAAAAFLAALAWRPLLRVPARSLLPPAAAAAAPAAPGGGGGGGECGALRATLRAAAAWRAVLLLEGADALADGPASDTEAAARALRSAFPEGGAAGGILVSPFFPAPPHSPPPLR